MPGGMGVSLIEGGWVTANVAVGSACAIVCVKVGSGVGVLDGSAVGSGSVAVNCSVAVGMSGRLDPPASAVAVNCGAVK